MPPTNVNLKKPATSAATAGAGKAPPPRQVKASNSAPVGKYSGMRGAAPRYPFLNNFDGVLEVIKTYESKNARTGSWFHLDAKVVEVFSEGDHAVDSNVTVLQCVSDKAIEVGGPIVISIVVAVTGYENDDDFFADFDGRDADHPTADDLLNYVSGADKTVENPLAGMKVRCRSYPSKASADGKTQYYGQTWEPFNADGEPSAD